jgi:DNA-binding NarL/FixJ family response regulator
MRVVKALTADERMVIESLIDGYPMPAIAQQLARPVKDVRSIVKVALAKVGAADRSHLRELRLSGKV